MPRSKIMDMAGSNTLDTAGIKTRRTKIQAIAKHYALHTNTKSMKKIIFNRNCHLTYK